MFQFRILSLVGLLMTFGAGSAIIGAQSLNHSVPPSATAAVKIGLLIPGQDALAAKHGAEMAIHEANEKGGYSGNPFQLIVRSTGGPWGSGSKESVGLVFDDEVVAIIGSLDGRNAHLAEQVVTKARIVFLSTWATDMTLSQAFVPWYFRCVPNDNQQASSMIHEIYKKRKIINVAIIGTEDYDSRVAVRRFVKTASSMNVTIPRQYLYGPSTPDFRVALKEIEQYDIEAIVLIGKHTLASDIPSLMQQENMNQTIFGSLSITDDRRAADTDWNILEGMNLVSSGHWFTERGIAFQKAFQKTFDYQPNAAAAYAYDGINLIIKVINKSGPDRDNIIDAFDDIIYKNGVTGEIRFDANGNRMDISDLMTVKNGNPLVIKADE